MATTKCIKIDRILYTIRSGHYVQEGWWNTPVEVGDTRVLDDVLHYAETILRSGCPLIGCPYTIWWKKYEH